MRKLLAVMSLLVLLAAAGCSSDGDESSTSGGGTEAPPVSLPGTTNNHGTKAAGDMEVELDDFYFGPTFIRARAGQRFTIELHNEGQVAHTFTSNALELNEELAPGARKKVSVSAPPGGATVFFCRFHQSQGMQGAIYIA